MILHTCVYCLEQKPLAEFNREHVIPQSFGKFQQNLVLAKEVCRECNDYFGDTLDRILARGSPQGIVRYLVGEKPTTEMGNSDRRRVNIQVDTDDPLLADQLTFVDTDEGKGISRMPGLRFWNAKSNEWDFVSLRQLESNKSGLLEHLDRSQVVVLIYTGMDVEESEKELGRIIAALRAYDLGVTIDAGPVEESKPGDILRVRIEVPEDDLTKRALTKIAFNYLTKTQGADFALNKGFNEVREYIRFEKHMERRFARRTVESRLDYGGIEASERHGHFVGVDWASRGRSVLGWVSLFQIDFFEITFGSYSGILKPLARGSYFDIISKTIIDAQTTPRPPGLWIPSVSR